MRGAKNYELSDHLGNVAVVVGDRRMAVDGNADLAVDFFEAEVLSARDFYPFGMVMPERSFSTSAYRYGFNGKEFDSEWKGEGNSYDYGFRVHDARLGRFLSVDPLAAGYPWNSPYSYAEGDVIRSIDLDGLERFNVILMKDDFGASQAIIRMTDHRQVEKSPTGMAVKWYKHGSNGELVELSKKPSTNFNIGNNTAIQDLFDSYNHSFSETGWQVGGESRQSNIWLLTTPWKEKEDDDPISPESPPILRIAFNPGASSLADQIAANTEMSNLANYLKKNPEKRVTLFGNLSYPQGSIDRTGNPYPLGNSPATLDYVYDGNFDGIPNISHRNMMLRRAGTVRTNLINTFSVDPDQVWIAPGTVFDAGQRLRVISTQIADK
jgi:RHS repeat-associated protein